MQLEEVAFFEAVINAGAILAGFCGTFLVFRIQREASYYRQPFLSDQEEEVSDAFIGLSHFTSSFLLIILAALVSFIFGLIVPLFGLLGKNGPLSPEMVVGGLVGAVVLLAGYFYDEMVHYGIFDQKLEFDSFEWKRELPIVIVTILLSGLASTVIYLFMS